MSAVKLKLNVRELGKLPISERMLTVKQCLTACGFTMKTYTIGEGGVVIIRALNKTPGGGNCKGYALPPSVLGGLR